jgi:hypothetical protein
MRIQVLSPDGFTIEFNKWSYPSLKKAEEAFEKWKKKYVVQGYYSSNFQRIPLNELKSYCQFKKIKS